MSSNKSNNLPSTILLDGRGRIPRDPSRRSLRSSPKPSTIAQEVEEMTLEKYAAKVTKEVDDMMIDKDVAGEDTSFTEDIYEVLNREKKEGVRKMYKRYQQVFFEFNELKQVHDKEIMFSDKNMLSFFRFCRAKYAPSTLWVIYSCINEMAQSMLGCDLRSRVLVSKYLKSQSSHYITKKSKTFTADQMHHAIMMCQESNDPSETLLGVGVSLQYYGLLRSADLKNILIEDVEIQPCGKITVTFDHGRKRRNEGFKFDIPSCYKPLFEKYLSEIKEDDPENSQFLKNFNKKSKMRIQNAGKENIKQFPKRQCILLKIDPKGYTTHAYRRSAATNLADQGVSKTNLKRHGQWKSDTAVEVYIAQSKPIRYERMSKLMPTQDQEKFLNNPKSLQTLKTVKEDSEINQNKKKTSDNQELDDTLFLELDVNNPEVPENEPLTMFSQDVSVETKKSNIATLLKQMDECSNGEDDVSTASDTSMTTNYRSKTPNKVSSSMTKDNVITGINGLEGLHDLIKSGGGAVFNNCTFKMK